MTTFGIDVSHWQAGLNLSVAQKQGYQFVAAKCTDGASFSDSSYEDFMNQAKNAGLLFCAYHFLRSTDAITSQADNLAAHIQDKSIPVMIDLEPVKNNKGTYISKPTLRQAAAFRSACAHRGIRVSLLYFPHFWWDETGRPSLGTGATNKWALWQADYGPNQQGAASVIYPGDGSPRWDVQGGVKPAILQFGSRGVVSGFPQVVDVDAFQGTRKALADTHYFKDFYVPKPVDIHLKAAFRANQSYMASVASITDTRAKWWKPLVLARLRRQNKRLMKWMGK